MVEPAPGIADQQEPEKARLRRDCTTVFFAKNFTLLSSGKPEVFPFWENALCRTKTSSQKRRPATRSRPSRGGLRIRDAARRHRRGSCASSAAAATHDRQRSG